MEHKLRILIEQDDEVLVDSTLDGILGATVSQRLHTASVALPGVVDWLETEITGGCIEIDWSLAHPIRPWEEKT